MHLCAFIFIIYINCSHSFQADKCTRYHWTHSYKKQIMWGPYLSFLRSPADTGLMEILGKVEREF